MPVGLIRTRIALALLGAVGLWRLAASVESEGVMVAFAGVDHRVGVLTADLDQRRRWTLRDDFSVYAALRPLVGETPRVILYGAATGVPRDAMQGRLTLLESQLKELLFPTRMSAVVGPIPAAAMPVIRPGMPPILVANLTPSEPLPEVSGLRVLVERPGYTVSILESP